MSGRGPRRCFFIESFTDEVAFEVGGMAKIAAVLPHLRAGGAEMVMIKIANGLAARGHVVELLVLNSSGSLGSLVSPEVRLTDLCVERTRFAFLPLVMHLRRTKPDSLISTLGRLNILVTIARPLLGAIRIVTREANTPSVDLKNDGHSFFTRLLYPFIYKRMDTIVCQSDAMMADLERSLGVPASKLRRIYNPAPDAEALGDLRSCRNPFQDTERPIVACGRLSHQKGFDLLINAFRYIHQRVPNSHLYILGDGELRDDLETLIFEVGLSESVTLCGYVEERYIYFFNAELVVSSSRWEGLPNVLIEAIACGTPVIATDCPGGTREIIQPGKNGWLVNNGDAAALAETVAEYLIGMRGLETGNVAQTLGEFEANQVICAYENLLCN